MRPSLRPLRPLLAEAIGTFCLVFAGTAAIVVDQTHPGTVTPLGISLVFGLVVAAMIYTVGDLSGAHLNPAVTLGFWWARRLPGRDVLPYVASQLCGAVGASLLVRLLFPTAVLLGNTLPSGSYTQSFVLELVLTFILVLTIMNVSTGAKEKGLMAGVAIGSVIAFEALLGGPISGASMNPARSFAPALVSGHFAALGIYLAAPIVGAWVAVASCRCLRDTDCCG